MLHRYKHCCRSDPALTCRTWGMAEHLLGGRTVPSHWREGAATGTPVLATAGGCREKTRTPSGSTPAGHAFPPLCFVSSSMNGSRDLSHILSLAWPVGGTRSAMTLGHLRPPAPLGHSGPHCLFTAITWSFPNAAPCGASLPGSRSQRGRGGLGAGRGSSDPALTPCIAMPGFVQSALGPSPWRVPAPGGLALHGERAGGGSCLRGLGHGWSRRGWDGDGVLGRGVSFSKPPAVRQRIAPGPALGTGVLGAQVTSLSLMARLCRQLESLQTPTAGGQRAPG